MLVVTLTSIWTISAHGRLGSIGQRTNLHAGITLSFSLGTLTLVNYSFLLFLFIFFLFFVFFFLFFSLNFFSSTTIHPFTDSSLSCFSFKHRLDLYKESGGKKNKKVLGLAWVSKYYKLTLLSTLFSYLLFCSIAKKILLAIFSASFSSYLLSCFSFYSFPSSSFYSFLLPLSLFR